MLLLALASLGCTAGEVDDAGTPADDAGVADDRMAPFLDACVLDPSCGDVLLVAHRGEGVAEPENSRAAIVAVALLGADIVEIDVRETSDGVPVILHDDTLTRTTNQSEIFPDRASVGELTLAEVKTLTLYDEEGRCGDASSNEERCRVPTLREALAVARGRVILMLDYKSAALSRVADDIVAEEAQDFAFFFDANEANLDEMETLVPGLVTMARANDATTGLNLLSRRQPALLHADTGYLAALKSAAGEFGTKLFVNVFVEVDFGIIAYELTGESEHLGLASDELARVVASGADVLQSNRTPVIREMLEE
jgi:glycerophosphoryl diester phosphodiesterase